MKRFLLCFVFCLLWIPLLAEGCDAAFLAQFLHIPENEFSLSRIDLGVANHVFWLEKNRVPCAVLKEYTRQDFSTVQTLHQHLEKLHHLGIKAPLPLLLFEENHHPCVIYPLCKGIHPFHPSSESLSLIAKEMALFHTTNAGFVPFRETLSKQVVKSWLHKCTTLDIQKKEFIETLLNQLEELPSTLLPKGLVHGDISPSNILIQDNMHVTFLDFDLMCQTDLLSDLTRAQIFFSFDEQGNFLPEICALFCSAYESIRPLTSVEKALFHTSFLFQLMKMFLETYYYVHEVKDVPIEIFQGPRQSQSPEILYQKLLHYALCHSFV